MANPNNMRNQGNTGLSTGFKKATALNPNGTTKTVFSNSVSATPFSGEGPSPTSWQGLFNKYLGTDYGYNVGMQPNNTYGYVENGKQMYTGDLSGNQAAMDYFKENPTSNLGGVDTALKGVQALSGLANAYLGYKNYKLAKDMFGFEKAATNRAIQNQASEYNTGIQNAGEVGMGLAGNTMDANARAARQAQLNSQKISTAPIG